MAAVFVPEKRSSYAALWVTVLSGPIVWTLRFLTSYLLVEIACRGGILLAPVGNLRVISLVVTAVTLLSLAAVVVSGLYSFRAIRSLNGHHPLFQEESLNASPARFMAASGILLNLLFGLLILLEGISPIVLPPCGG